MHPATEQLLSHFSYAHLETGSPHQKVSAAVGELAVRLANELPESAETTAGLRKLLEAKDCFVRAALPLRSAAGTQENTADVPWFPLR